MKRLALLLVAPLAIAACDNNPAAPTRLTPEDAPSAIMLPGCATPAPEQVKALISAVLFLRGLTPDQHILVLTPLFDAAKALAARDYAGAISAMQRFVRTIGGKTVIKAADEVETPAEGLPAAEEPKEETKALVKLPVEVRDPLVAAANCVISVLNGFLPPPPPPRCDVFADPNCNPALP